MTDSYDPFAQRPAQPAGEGDSPATDDATTASSAPTPSSAEDQPTVEQPTSATPANRYPTDHEYAAPSTPTGSPAAGTGPDERSDHEPTIAMDPTPTTTDARSTTDDHDGTAAAGAAGGGAAFGFGAAGATPPKRPRRGSKLVAAVAIVALAGAAGYGGSYLQTRGDSGSGAAPISSLDGNEVSQTSLPDTAVEQVAAKVLPSVTQINVKGARESGSGTGIIISSDGNILTNNHVVEPAADGGSITVAFSDGTNAEATIVGRDPVTDIAVIKAEGKSGLTPASLGTSADLQVGQDVVAIGSPFGLESTVTTGIVSALNRPVTSSDGSGSGTPTVFPAVQTDAAINPGNSGGPLVDLNGNVIGINSAIRAGSSGPGQSGSIGLGFAIPVDLAKNISKQLLAGEQAKHAQIGVTVRPAVSGDEITGIGAEIAEVSGGSPGEEAGLQTGDIITAVNGNAVASSDALVASIRAYQPGETVEVTFLRDGDASTVDVTLGSDADAG